MFSPMEDAVVLDQRDILGKKDELLDFVLRDFSLDILGVVSALGGEATGTRSGVARGTEAPRLCRPTKREPGGVGFSRISCSSRVRGSSSFSSMTGLILRWEDWTRTSARSGEELYGDCSAVFAPLRS